MSILPKLIYEFNIILTNPRRLFVETNVKVHMEIQET
jgi:hypothetical protein